MVIIHINFNRYCLAVHLEKPNVFLLNTTTACFINLKLLLHYSNLYNRGCTLRLYMIYKTMHGLLIFYLHTLQYNVCLT